MQVWLGLSTFQFAFAVASSIDSRVILDIGGAETLLGRGDMLFLNPEVGSPIRAQGVSVTDMEIERVIDHWQKSKAVPVEAAPPWEKLLSEPDDQEDEGKKSPPDLLHCAHSPI